MSTTAAIIIRWLWVQSLSQGLLLRLTSAQQRLLLVVQTLEWPCTYVALYVCGQQADGWGAVPIMQVV